MSRATEEYFFIWLRLTYHSFAIFYDAYISLNSSKYADFFDCLTSKVEHILTHFHFEKITILSDSTFANSFDLHLLLQINLMNKILTLSSHGTPYPYI